MLATKKIRDLMRDFPKVDLIHLPTPFRRLERLSEALGGPDLFIKRDDMTGLAFGGNKSRKLEFILADILAKKADTVVTWASLQSNWCMQTAAAARRFGIEPVLLLFRAPGPRPAYDGNLLLDRILGADIRIREAKPGQVIRWEQAIGFLEEIAQELRKKGRRPYLVPVGGSLVRGDMDKPFGALSYVGAFAEMLDQARALAVEPDYIVHATGSGGTQGGLTVGAKAMTEGCRVLGISVSDPKSSFSKDVLEIALATDEMLGLKEGIRPEDVIVLDEYVGTGYGSLEAGAAAAIRLVFQKEGIVLDPVYTAKAMAGLLDLVRKGYFKKTDKVVFFHTGGTPALFPHRDKLLSLLD